MGFCRLRPEKTPFGGLVIQLVLMFKNLSSNHFFHIVMSAFVFRLYQLRTLPNKQFATLFHLSLYTFSAFHIACLLCLLSYHIYKCFYFKSLLQIPNPRSSVSVFALLYLANWLYNFFSPYLFVLVLSLYFNFYFTTQLSVLMIARRP